MTDPKSPELGTEDLVIRTIERLMQATRLLLGLLLLASIALNFVNAVARYLFLAPIEWAEEVMTFIMLWCVFLGAALVTWNDQHLRMDVIAQKLSPKFQTLLQTAALVCMVAILLFLLKQSLVVLSTVIRFGQLAAVSELPIAIPHAAIPAGFILMLIAILGRFWLQRTGRVKHAPDPGSRSIKGAE
jgi:TRAP-type C4-dicarboxylate transport system permease small subunit